MPNESIQTASFRRVGRRTTKYKNNVEIQRFRKSLISEREFLNYEIPIIFFCIDRNILERFYIKPELDVYYLSPNPLL